MSIRIGNAPCSWGVEFAKDDRNPTWQTVLEQCSRAGYTGIELGPVGFMPEDPAELGDALAAHKMELIGGVVFRAFHDKNQWDDVMDGAVRTCKALQAHGAKHFVLIDSISPRRAPTAGRGSEAEQMDTAEWTAYRDRIMTIAKLGYEEYGLIPEIHPHAGGFMDFEPEVERLLEETDPEKLKICIDTGHCTYAGFDPVAFMQRHMERITYVHFKSTDAKVKAAAIANRTGFYEACGQGIFCNLADGEVDFPAVRKLLLDANYSGWCTIEQDCDPLLDPDPERDARLNREYLQSIGFA
ncbi:sugar phosphate isomerase/epimerase family protein [Granulosicoccus antarcticus]|uniref:Inosose dehydratase n=1 Tax=Granulosicoccus antarcticus IMCC3135 TaxID=1192854 RepID=A0A2Z2P1M4_9GAMM|nr:TIM barrel protein [Granulosicoccus antarcticus]ASJ74367.1 Inosose dehydratase [Granulosicoccus antarcticus IMCC3135]